MLPTPRSLCAGPGRCSEEGRGRARIDGGRRSQRRKRQRSADCLELARNCLVLIVLGKRSRYIIDGFVFVEAFGLASDVSGTH